MFTVPSVAMNWLHQPVFVNHDLPTWHQYNEILKYELYKHPWSFDHYDYLDHKDTIYSIAQKVTFHTDKIDFFDNKLNVAKSNKKNKIVNEFKYKNRGGWNQKIAFHKKCAKTELNKLPLWTVNFNSDILDAPLDHVLCHCISQCQSMSDGLAKTLCRVHPELRETPKVDLTHISAFQTDSPKSRLVLSLVTKPTIKHFPTLQNLAITFKNLAEIVNTHKIYDLAIPRLGCGLDRQSWEIVKNLIDRAFRYSFVNIHLYVDGGTELLGDNFKLHPTYVFN